MARDVDDKKKRKALRKLRKAAERAQAEGGPGLSDWEKEFVEKVEARVEKYGSAFADPDKGNLDEPLSALQTQKLKEIDKKSRGKGGGFKKRSGFKSSFKSKSKSSYKPRVRDIHEDIEEALQAPSKEAPSIGPQLVRGTDLLAKQTASSPRSIKPALRIIKGGKDA